MYLSLNKEQKLVVDIINEYPDVLKDRKRFIGILSDCIHEDNALKKALLDAYDEDIINIIKEENNLQHAIYLSEKKLENNCGLASNVSRRALTVVASICGRISELEALVGEEFNNIISEKDETIYKKEYNNGYIEYVLADNGIIVTNAEFYQNIRKMSATIVFPEKIKGYNLIGIKSDALNNIRKCRFKRVVLPYTLEFVGEDNCKLYENFKEKGVFPKPIIYVAPKQYLKYQKISDFFTAMTDIKNEDYFGFETAQEIIDNSGLVPIRQDERDCWNKPMDGVWVSREDCLITYTGSERDVYIGNCKAVATNAFENSSVEVITFAPEVNRFSTGMIHNCNELKKIEFCAKDRCWFSDESIYDCQELSEIIWPPIYNFEQISIFHDCKKLGNMIIYHRLLTYQEDGQIITIDNDVTHINNHAFISCQNASVVIIPSNVDVVEDKAFEKSSIKVVVFEGQYTQWRVQTNDNISLYVFCRRDSNVMRSLSPYEEHSNIYMKNIDKLSEVLESKDEKRVEAVIGKYLDEISDEEMILKPYHW